MTLSSGTKIAHYEITTQIGRGGMGEVYQAKDLKLGRDVAIKVLPEEFAKDADRVARFQREAKLLASLNHPNIAAIHGLEEYEGTHFLVLELVEGETLSEPLKRGPIPVEESLKLAMQIAEALEAAHENGVIHRDLKPANIKVTPDGKVKVLDFGLAKAFAGDQEEMVLSDSPTLTMAETRKGVILGTAAYMSPEQARGKSVDKRADIWAFGCVLFEMLTGRAAFSGKDVTDILAAVIRSEPDWSSLPKNLHLRLREVIERCLEKEVKDRYGSINDARVDIKKVLADPSGVLVQPVAIEERRTKLRTNLPWVAAIIITGIIVGVVIWNLRQTPQPEPRQVNRFYYELPEDQAFTSTGRPLVAVSADGTKIVYVANQQLYLRNFDELTARPIQGTDEAPTTPFFSPDGQWVGYYSYADSQLKRITVSGGAPVTLCDAFNPYGATWGVDNTILYGQEAGILRVSANGGPAELIVETEDGEQVHGPQVLPGGEWVLFTVTSTLTPTRWDEAQIVVQSLKTGERKVLISGGSDARYVPTGHLVYALGAVLYAIGFDANSLEVKGGAVPVVEGVQRAYMPGLNTGSANYGFSDTAMLAYVVGSGETTLPPRSLVWVNRGGQEEPLKASLNMYKFPKISPDGTRVALTTDISGNNDIWIWDLVYKNLTRLTFNDGIDDIPLWTPDGKRIVFRSVREEDGVYWKAADGTGEAELLASVPGRTLLPFSWSSDGKTLVTQEIIGLAVIDIGTLSMEGDRKLTPLLQEEDYAESHPSVSPDGRWIAYCSAESGLPEIFVRPFPEVNKGKWQISTDGGNSPLWSPDGRELFYLIGFSTTEAVMRVAVETEPSFKRGTPEVLFRGTYVGFYPGDFPWDIHPDGKRFLMLKESTSDTSTEETSRPKIIIVLNWLEELKQRVPVHVQ